jgi:hypothetical protein
MSEEGIFLGIDVDHVLMRFQQDEPTRFRLDSVVEIKGSDERFLTGPDLRKLSRSGSIPGLTYIAISFEGSDISLSYESVRTFRIPTSKNAAAIGFGVGLAVDIVAVALIVSAMNDLDDNCGTTKSN